MWIFGNEDIRFLTRVIDADRNHQHEERRDLIFGKIAASYASIIVLRVTEKLVSVALFNT